jgi:hypothetical protein
MPFQGCPGLEKGNFTPLASNSMQSPADNFYFQKKNFLELILYNIVQNFLMANIILWA